MRNTTWAVSMFTFRTTAAPLTRFTKAIACGSLVGSPVLPGGPRLVPCVVPRTPLEWQPLPSRSGCENNLPVGPQCGPPFFPPRGPQTHSRTTNKLGIAVGLRRIMPIGWPNTGPSGDQTGSDGPDDEPNGGTRKHKRPVAVGAQGHVASI